MPFLLDETDIVDETSAFDSVLLVPCRFCPAASAAVRSSEPYIDFPRRGLETASYERLIERTKHDLESRGVRVGVFKSKLLHQFVLCMWTSRRRNHLMEVAKEYDAVVVMGCEGAVQTVSEAVRSSGCRVIPGMKNTGLMSIRPGFALPCKISLELESVSPVLLEQSS